MLVISAMGKTDTINERLLQTKIERSCAVQIFQSVNGTGLDYYYNDMVKSVAYQSLEGVKDMSHEFYKICLLSTCLHLP